MSSAGPLPDGPPVGGPVPGGPAPARPVRADRAFFDRDVLTVAEDLLGAVVVHAAPAHGAAATPGAPVADPGVAVRLTEVEAYGGPQDPGSHARAGLTPRTATMFGPPGHAYVYLSYGMHWCLNLVAAPDGEASGVLLRGGEVVDGLEVARARRPAARTDRDLARGPARLAAALGITGDHRGVDACAPGGRLRVLVPAGGTTGPASSARGGRSGEGGDPPTTDRPGRVVLAGPRTGVSGPGGGEEWPWRLHLAGEPTVSAYRAAVPRRRSGRVAP